jgi:HD superfamily phosphohydrolase
MYFIDALYGNFDIEISKDLLCAPELQRLREIRLCNINSPFITGGTSLNRFEHAIGTAYLAQEIIKLHRSNNDEREAFIIAALLHDVVTAPFGHSLEYLFESIKDVTYEHANIWQMIFSGKTIPSSRTFFCGKKAILHTLFKHDKLEMIQNILEGKHALSILLANDIDIDNIDNVFRFAFHLGIPFNREIPLQLTRHSV